MSLPIIALLSLAALSAAGGQLLFKVAAEGRTQIIEFLNLPLFIGLFLYALSTATWIYALSLEKLVNVYAFTALTFALVYLGGVFLLGESLKPVAMLGIGLVLAGLYLITSQSS